MQLMDDGNRGDVPPKLPGPWALSPGPRAGAGLCVAIGHSVGSRRLWERYRGGDAALTPCSQWCDPWGPEPCDWFMQVLSGILFVLQLGPEGWGTMLSATVGVGDPCTHVCLGVARRGRPTQDCPSVEDGLGCTFRRHFDANEEAG